MSYLKKDGICCRSCRRVFANLCSSLEHLAIEGDSKAEAVINKVQKERSDAARRASSSGFLRCITEQMRRPQRRSLGAHFLVWLLRGDGLGPDVWVMDADSKARLWEMLNNINCMCILYDQREADTPFKDITQFAQRLLTMFQRSS